MKNIWITLLALVFFTPAFPSFLPIAMYNRLIPHSFWLSTSTSLCFSFLIYAGHSLSLSCSRMYGALYSCQGRVSWLPLPNVLLRDRVIFLFFIRCSSKPAPLSTYFESVRANTTISWPVPRKSLTFLSAGIEAPVPMLSIGVLV